MYTTDTTADPFLKNRYTCYLSTNPLSGGLENSVTVIKLIHPFISMCYVMSNKRPIHLHPMNLNQSQEHKSIPNKTVVFPSKTSTNLIATQPPMLFGLI